MAELRFEGLLVKVLGSALKGTVSGFLRGLGIAVAPDILAAALGYYLYSRQTGWVKDFGEGLLIGAAAQIVSPIVQQVAGGVVGGATAATATTTAAVVVAPTPESVARQVAMG